MSAERDALQRKLGNAIGSYTEGYGGKGAVTSARAALDKYDAEHAAPESDGIVVVSRAEQVSCSHHWVPRSNGAMKCACGASYVHGHAVEVLTQMMGAS